MRDHSTKKQLKEKSLHARIILSNTLHALLLFKIQKDSEFSVDLRQRFSHMPTVPLARSSCLEHPARALGVFPASVMLAATDTCVRPRGRAMLWSGRRGRAQRARVHG